ncbi:MAG: hypothetical protein Q4E28_05345 [Clostridia bacterium]|nr:hypothetical protein [Clostridia bacterium]
MKQILSNVPLDTVLHPSGLCFVTLTDKLKKRIGFNLFNFKTQRIVRIKKSDYLRFKFGPPFEEIKNQMKDYLTCSVETNSQGYINVIYPTGEMGIFNKNGLLVWLGDLAYHEKPVQSIALVNNDIWTVCPEENAIVRYKTALNRFDFRIGGKNAPVFSNPCQVRFYDDQLYVCCKDTGQIKTVQLNDFVIKNYLSFDSEIYDYIRYQDKEIVMLSTGTYII